MHKKIIYQIERLTEKAGSAADFFGECLKNLFFGKLGIRLTYRREAVIMLLIAAAALIFFTPSKWMIWSGILLMVVGMLLWLIIIFSWTLDPMIDYKIRVRKIRHWGKRLLKYLSGEFRDIEARHHTEAYAWGKLAYFEELKSEVAGFSKTDLLRKFLGRFFSTFMILIFGYAFIFFGLQKITENSFISSAQQAGLAAFGSIADFIYYSAITIATVGYGDIYPVHAFARVFVIAEVLSGALLVIFLVSSFTAISISLTAERQQALIGEIEKEISGIDKIFSELKHLQKEG